MNYDNLIMKGGENMAKRKFKRLTEDDFNQIKLLLNTGLKTSQIMQITKRVNAVIVIAEKANTFAEYRQLMREKNDKEKKPVEEKVVANGETANSIVTMHDIMTILEKINSNLERLADAWEKEPERSGLRRFL
jgi:3-dehydroquinate synthetase